MDMPRHDAFRTEWAFQQRRSQRAVGEEIGFAWGDEHFRMKNGALSRYEVKPLPRPTAWALRPKAVRA